MSLPKWAKEFDSSNYAQTKLKNLNNVDSNGERSDYATIRSTPLANNLNTPLAIMSTTTEKKGLWSKWSDEYDKRLQDSGNSNLPGAIKGIGKGLGFALDYLPNNIGLLKPFQRAVNSGAEAVMGKGQLIDYNGNKIVEPNANLHTNKVVDFIADQAGNLAGISAIPMGGKNLYNAGEEVNNLLANKLTGKIGNTALRGYAKTAAENALNMGLGSAADTARFGGNAKDITKSGLQGALTGAAFGVAGKGLGDLKKGAFPEWKTTYESTSDLKPLSDDLKAKGTTTKENILNPLKNDLGSTESTNIDKIKSNELNPLKTSKTPELDIQDEGTLTKTINDLQDKINKSTDQNEIKAMNLQLMAAQKQLQKTRKFISNSVMNSEIAPEEMKSTIEKQPYIQISNKETWRNALNKVEKNQQSALTEFGSQNSLKSADDTALGQALIVKAIKEGRIEDANDLSINLAEKLTRAGQTVQAASIFKRLTPEGMLQYANGIVNRVNQAMEKEVGKNAKKVKLSSEEATKILEGMKEYAKMPEGDAKNVKIAQVMQIINDKVPVSLNDKIRTLRNISLLGNAKTNVRNVIGNTIMGVADNVSNVVGTPIDKLVSLKTKQRSEGLPNLKILGSGALKGGSEGISDSFGGLTLKDLKGLTLKEKAEKLLEGFTNPIDRDLGSGGKYEIGRSLSFKNKPMRIAENVVNTGLKVGDNVFKKAYYDDVLNQLMKTNKVAEATDEMKAIAQLIAEERTYQDSNALSQLGSALKNSPQRIKNPAAREGLQFAVDSQLPYVKTPLNILKRATEYTPLGIVEGTGKLVNGIKNDTLDIAAQRKAVDRLSRGIVGTGIMGLGALGAKKGILTGAANKDKDKAAFDQQTGKQPFAVKMGNKYYNFDWAQPASIPLSAGIQMTQGKKGGLNANNTFDAIANAANFYTDQPMLTNIQKLIGNQYGKSLGNRVVEAGLGIPNQFVPTALKQMTQMGDKQVRSSYSPDSITKGLLNPMLAKIPGANKTLQPKYDTLGRPIEQYQGKNNFGNVMLNPGNLTTDKSTDEEKFLDNLYNETGDSKIFPRVVPSSFTYKGQTINLTSKEYADFQKNVGEQTYRMLGMLKNESLNDNTAQLIASLMTVIQNKERDRILNNRGLATEDTFDPWGAVTKKATAKNNGAIKDTILSQLGIK